MSTETVMKDKEYFLLNPEMQELDDADRAICSRMGELFRHDGLMEDKTGLEFFTRGYGYFNNAGLSDASKIYATIETVVEIERLPARNDAEANYHFKMRHGLTTSGLKSQRMAKVSIEEYVGQELDEVTEE